MEKQKHQIVDEVIALVNTQGRAMMGTHCVYLTPDCKKCGHGMAIEEEYLPEIMTIDPKFASATDIIHKFGDKVHKEEYQGHSVDFWEKIQELHDRPKYWNSDNTLTKKGRRFANRIKKAA